MRIIYDELMANNYQKKFIKKHTWKERNGGNEEKEKELTIIGETNDGANVMRERNDDEEMEEKIEDVANERGERFERYMILPWCRGLERLTGIFRKKT